MIDQNTGLWVFAIVATAYIGWADIVRPWRQDDKAARLELANGQLKARIAALETQIAWLKSELKHARKLG